MGRCLVLPLVLAVASAMATPAPGNVIPMGLLLSDLDADFEPLADLDARSRADLRRGHAGAGDLVRPDATPDVAAVPEPAGLALLAVGGLLIGRRRRGRVTTRMADGRMGAGGSD